MRYRTSSFTIHWRFSVPVQTYWNQTKVYTNTFSVECSKYSLCNHLIVTITFRRAHQFTVIIKCRYNQLVAVKTLSVLEQMTYDLMGLEKNAYNSNFGGLNEDAVIDFAIKNKFSNLLRVIYQKTRYVKYMCGDMDAAAKHYDLQQELYANCAGHAATGKL